MSSPNSSSSQCLHKHPFGQTMFKSELLTLLGLICEAEFLPISKLENGSRKFDLCGKDVGAILVEAVSKNIVLKHVLFIHLLRLWSDGVDVELCTLSDFPTEELTKTDVGFTSTGSSFLAVVETREFLVSVASCDGKICVVVTEVREKFPVTKETQRKTVIICGNRNILCCKKGNQK